MTAERKKRHLRILELISTRRLGTQEELAEALRLEGWSVTQSSVSRDIATLGLVKADGAYARPARTLKDPNDPDERRIAESLLAVDPAGDALLIIHTPPGEANRLAVALDRLAWTELMGTIAGDDTIFVAVRDGKAQREVLRRLKRLGGQRS
jgi:transcriptional regulator of arginine metabolism